jgi:hypothetical protein
MKIFPTKELNFRLVNDEVETLNRLNRRTEKSENLTSQFTEKSFRGIINGNEFKLISSSIGKGAFCVMTGKIKSGEVKVKVEIHKVFRILLSIMLLFPIIGIVAITVSEPKEFSLILILVAIGQILIIRFAFIGLIFKFLSTESLNRLRDVLDLE